MSARCEKYVGNLGHLAAGELRGLERRRVETHLLACAPCRTAVDDLRGGLAAARTWEPSVSQEHLAALNQRLEPMLGPPNRHAVARGKRWILGGALLAACALLLVIGAAMLPGLRTAEPAPAPVAERTPEAPGVRIVRAAPAVSGAPSAPLANDPAARMRVERRQLGPHLRMVANAGWQGRVEGEPGDHSVHLTAGFVVLDFIGGEGRRLRVSTPDALVEVVGTRFFVEVDGDVTRVRVSEGQVRVLTLLGLEVLRAGDRLTVGNDDGRASAADRFLSDTYLLEHRAAPSLDVRKPPRRQQLKVERAASARGLTSPHILERLSQAEQVASAGEYREAIELYRDITKDTPQGTLRDLARYEMARLWGFRMGEIQRARSLLGPLAKGSGEVSRQARLALCELDLKARPCAAAACLRRIEQNAEDFPLREEATRLLDHWNLEQRECK